MSLISLPLAQGHHILFLLLKYMFKCLMTQDTEPEDDNDFVIMENFVQVVGKKINIKFSYIILFLNFSPPKHVSIKLLEL